MNNYVIRLLKPFVDQFPKLAMTYRQLRDSAKVYHEPQPTPMGFRLAGDRGMQCGHFEPEETRIVQAVLPCVDVVVNVGANIGYYCLIALQQGKYVIAFEPMPRNLGYLLRNIKANLWDSRIEVYPIAVSDKVGVTEIYGGGTGASLLRGWAGTPAHYATLVPSSTLDHVVGTRFHGTRTFVLVDIEGAEYLMLKGAHGLLALEPSPIWMMEISITEHQPAGVAVNPNLLATFRAFWDRGYRAWTADTKRRPVHEDEIHVIMETGIDTLRTHNFLFLKDWHGGDLVEQ